MSNEKKEERKIHILNTTTYMEESDDGEASIQSVDSPALMEAPEGMVWHAVLGKFVPEMLADVEMIVDASELTHLEPSED